MIIEIDDTKTITEMQETFILEFPYLKIEFFKIPHGYEEASPEEMKYNPTFTLGEIRKKHNPGMIEVFPWTKTAFLEQELKRHFGLNAQLYRLQKEEWVQVVGTDWLTLREQNDIGRAAAGKPA